MKKFSTIIQVIDTSDAFELMKSELARFNSIAVDTETTGLEARQAKLTLDMLTMELELRLHRLDRITHVYKKRYKQRCLLTRAKRVALQDDIAKLQSEIRAVTARVAKNPGALHHLTNILSCVQLGVDYKENGGIGAAYCIRPSIIDTDWLQDYLTTRSEVLMHNSKFDIKQLRHHLGITLTADNLVDTQAREYGLTMGTRERIGLKPCLQKYCGVLSNKKIACEYWDGEWTEEMLEYAANDVLHLFDIARAQDRGLAAMPHIMTGVLQDQALAVCLARMELAGIGVDVDLAQRALELAEREAEELTNDIRNEMCIDNPLSNAQLLNWVRAQGARASSVDLKSLQGLNKRFPVLNKVIELRQARKRISTYYQPIVDKSFDGRVYPTFNAVGKGTDEAGTETNRLSSSDPNLQNQPKRGKIKLADGEIPVRAMFIPRPGFKFIDIDLSQIEPRILAYVSGDPTLRQAFNDGLDVYKFMGSLMYGVAPEDITKEQRDKMKVALLSVMYLKSAYGLAADPSYGMTEKEAQRFLDGFFKRFLPVKRFIKTTISTAVKSGYVELIGGGVRFLPDLRSSVYKIRKHGERAAVNTRIQGSAARGMKAAIIKAYQLIDEARLSDVIIPVLNVHDQLIAEVKDDPELIPIAMELIQRALVEGTGELIPGIPVVAEPKLINNWGESAE